MLSFSRILVILASCSALVSALPADISERDEVSERDLIEFAEEMEVSDVNTRATLATVITKCTKANTVALTFDDGPYTWNKLIVDTLVSNGAKGTFFVNGNNYQCIYNQANVDRLKYAKSKGMQIASHTWSHPDLATLSVAQCLTEFQKIDKALLNILGIKSAYVRPPYGSYGNNARQAAATNGQKLVTWDFDSGDSVGASVSQSEAKYAAIAKNHPSNILTLNHETISTTAHTVLPYAIKTLKAKGYKLVTVAECLGQSAYTKTTTPKSRDSTWKC